ncbi:MAG TPA: sodium:proton antiporter [Marinagarivorans sp.]
MYLDIALIAGCTLLFGCIAGLVERSWVSGPLIFMVVGYTFGPHGLGVFSFSADIDVIKTLAEITLAIVLFNDAASIGLKPLEKHPQIPTRTLLLALPMTLALGTGLAWLIFPELPWVHAALLSIILAPTDAALGLAVIKNPVVPAEIRRGLNAESGLNDGICVPFLLVFLALAGQYTAEQSIGNFALITLIEEIGIGAFVGAAVSAAGLIYCRYAMKKQWISEQWLVVPTLSIAVMAFGLAQYLEGSGFIAAFCGGLLFGDRLKGAYADEMQTSEINGEVFSLLTWMLFGALLLNVVQDITWPQVAYAALSLTVIRMLPVFLSLTGTGLGSREKLFIGWFGPRGLASIVFAIMLMQSGIEGGDVIVNTASLTIVFSVILHGITAFPLSKLLAKRQP